MTEKRNIINLNKDIFLNIDKFPYGKTQNIIIKIGKKYHYIDIEKNKSGAVIQRYDYFRERTKQSKYGNKNLQMVFIKNDALLDKSFLLNISDVEKAQNTVKKFKHILNI